MSVERYLRDAMDLVRQHDEPDDDALADAIAALVHRYVAHDMEWAALAVEAALTFDLSDVRDVTDDERPNYIETRVRQAVASIRERGR